MGLTVLAVSLALEHPAGIGGALADPQPIAWGRALFFALSLALLVEFAAHIPLAAQRDPAALRGALILDPAQHARLSAALVEQAPRVTAMHAALGAGLGLAHAGLGWG